MGLFRALAFGIAWLLTANIAAAAVKEYPTRPIRWIVAFPAGGANDTVARLVGQYVSERLGQPVIIENKAGAGGNIGTQAALAAAPDGYTLLFAAPHNAINANLYKKLPFDFLKDTAPIAGIARTPNVMEVTPSLPVKSVAEFIAYAKANPGKINMASAGTGTAIHLSGELFMAMTGVKLVHVPYRGGAPALSDMIGGQVQVMFDNLPSSIAHIQSGKLRALAVTTSVRSTSLPNVPTVAETVAGYEAGIWYGVVAPKGTPPEIIEKLNRIFTAALADTQVRSRLADLGCTPMPMSSVEFGTLLKAETAKWAKVIQFSGASAE